MMEELMENIIQAVGHDIQPEMSLTKSEVSFASTLPVTIDAFGGTVG
jgi:hypothetical protein